MTISPRSDLSRVLSPRSVAVIGASNRTDSLGRAIFANILLGGYRGIVYPVNPQSRSIMGVRAYRTIAHVPDEVDVAVIIVPADQVAPVLEACGRKEVSGAIIISAGFKEIGAEGAERERKVRELAKEWQISVIGPNCLGVINTSAEVSLNATFARIPARPGRIAFISQSGAVGAAALEHAHAENIGLSKFISIGNKALVNENHLLDALAEDPDTDVILLYLEDLEDPRTFVELARTIAEKKPILAIKSGRTRAGAEAAASHTGALARSDEAYQSIFEQCGVLRVDSIKELFEYAVAFATQPLPHGNRVAIVTNAGGPGIMATDAAIRRGLDLATLGAETRTRLRAVLPPTASVRNPVDLVGDADADRYRAALHCVLRDEAVDGLIVITTPQMLTSLERIAVAVAGEVGAAPRRIPCFACFMALDDVGDSLDVLDQHAIARYPFPEDASRAFAALARYAAWRHRPRTEVAVFADVDREKAMTVIAAARAAGRRFLPEPEAHAVVAAYGLPLAPGILACSEEDAVRAAREVGYPVVAKIVSPDIVHKVDVGGVRLGIADDEGMRLAWKQLLSDVRAAAPHAALVGAFVQRQVGGGIETIIGLRRDPHFGPILMFGLGGIWVETLRDVTFRLAPVRRYGAERMVAGIRAANLLAGVRGAPPADRAAIATCLQRLSQLAIELPEVTELDINPLIVGPVGSGATVVDARILL
ncbi:MAG: acetate--CoA ligase family protein [Candidatus Schekmanbacteria bacterium]|nr:acetate--CoA ligase family protein [Candidatus Schekmanbacteria bacterium]